MTNNISIASYPNIRMRRNRKSDWSRRLVKENQISVNDLILPIFVTDSEKKTAINEENIVCKATRLIKDNIKGIGIITDVALDPYTSHGHDGIIKNNEILNDETLSILCKQAIIQTKAGSDIIAPSDMMDGRVQAIRTELDKYGYKNTQIMSYAAKYASCFYGPFRNAIGSEKNLSSKSKKSYQMDFSNSDEALREVINKG